MSVVNTVPPNGLGLCWDHMHFLHKVRKPPAQCHTARGNMAAVEGGPWQHALQDAKPYKQVLRIGMEGDLRVQRLAGWAACNQHASRPPHPNLTGASMLPQLLVYSLLLSLGLYALYDQAWLRHSCQFWRDWPQHTLP